MSQHLALAFVAFAAAALFSPGPNNIMLMASGLNHGFRRTLPHVAGVTLGFAFLVAVIGIGLGAHVMSLDAALSTANFGSEGASQSAPLPVLTLYAQFALTNRWLLRVRVDRLSLDTGDVVGSIFSSGTDFVYQPWRHFGLGLGYRDINMTMSSTSERWRGKAQVRHTGPYLFVSSTF